ncbi:PLC-like phosphodiesterase [Saitoella complicata NRRL Y-17804]|uniref:PLC-like phosphodiesterase n=1 Tax=Saitoella complicata (strain BCRC 22490 / CBS 7301 / JCM 7358 / NBRC 10748 / NRRL Y-17804) TaxID=698492 RepID=UPI0008670DA0|nr:PLC-like phosphodiesterase [Saitoella complicata NRRL Y-17804]ODQ55987.1 PLC-like phosphodiesterase [Saitoella complicata NRRL Y-17804]
MASALSDDEIDYSNWHHTLFSSTPSFIEHATFKDLVYPGTHDSGAYGSALLTHTADNKPFPMALPYLGSKGVEKLRNAVQGVTRMQESDVTSQLKHGARYLDLRFATPKGKGEGELWLTHAFAYNPAEEVLREIASFVQEHPGEILIFLCRNAYPQNTQTPQITSLVLKHLGAYAHPNLCNNSTYTSLAHMLSTNQRVILAWETAPSVPYDKEVPEVVEDKQWWRAEQLFSWTWLPNNGDWKPRTAYMVTHARTWEHEYGQWNPRVDLHIHSELDEEEEGEVKRRLRNGKKILIWSHQISYLGSRAIPAQLMPWNNGRTFRELARSYNNVFPQHFPFSEREAERHEATEEALLPVPEDVRDNIGIIHVDFHNEVYKDLMAFTISSNKRRMKAILSEKRLSGPYE